MAATQWPIEIAALDDLLLDPHNVRVREGRGDGLTAMAQPDAEAAIARYMVEAEELLDLIEDILRDGYLDNEIPVVVRQGKRFVVLEGNRRSTALKVIANPALLGAKEAARVERLLGRPSEHEPPTEIRIMVAPSREAAQPLLARLHIGRDKKSWISEQQAIFFHAQLDEETTVDDLRARYSSESSKIPKKIRMGEMREVIRGLYYEDDDLRHFVLNSDLKMATFEYAYTPKAIHTALGLEFSKDGLLVDKKISEGQRRALMYLLGRFKAKTLNTRSAELIARNPEHQDLVETLKQIVAGGEPPATPGSASPEAPAGGAGGRDETDDTDATEETPDDADASKGAPSSGGWRPGEPPGGRGGSSEDPKGSTRGPNRGDTLSRLNMEGFRYAGASDGLRRRFEELQRLDVRDYPNATHDLLRTVLECSIKDYYRAKGRPLKEGTTIGPAVESLAREFQGNSKMTAAINVIKRTGRMSAQQYAGTTDSLNVSNHEPDHFAEGRDVHAAWERLKPILIEMVGKKPSAS